MKTQTDFDVLALLAMVNPLTPAEQALLADGAGRERTLASIIEQIDSPTSSTGWVHRRLALKRRNVVLAVTVLAAIGTASIAIAGHRDAVPNGAGGAQFAPDTGPIPDLGSTPDEISASLIARIPAIESITVSNDPVPDEEPQQGVTYVSTAHIVIHEDGTTGGYDLADWESDLAAGAMASEYAEHDLGTIKFVSITLVAPDGTRLSDASSVGNVVADQVFDAVPANLADTVTANAKQFGFKDVQVSTLQVLQDAIEIKVESDSPVADVSALRATGIQALLGETPNDFEGVFFEVDDSAGTLQYAQGYAPRAGDLLTSVNRCSGIQVGGRPAAPSSGSQPPGCPPAG